MRIATNRSHTEIDSAIGTCKHVGNSLRSAELWGAPGEGTQQGRIHLVSPEPFEIDKKTLSLLVDLGHSLYAFYSAMNDLYLRAGFDWVREYLDIGKGEELIKHSRMNYQKHAIPRVIRPDILLTPEGPIITELDSVPGGIGHLDCLSAAYERCGFELVGSPRGVLQGFANMIRDAGGSNDPVCSIIVSDESIDYLPEMKYLAAELRQFGLHAYTVRPREVEFTEGGLVIEPYGERLRVDVVYRFFELFDLPNIPKWELVAYAAKHRLAVVTPPYKPFLEEKIMLALLHNKALEEWWQKSIGEEHYRLLRQLIAPTWILDNRPVPPHAHISGFRWRNKLIRDWREIESGTQKERRLVIKPSGFSPLAWGSRGVIVGHDMSQEDWANAVEKALEGFRSTPYVLQPFYDTTLYRVRYYNESTEDICEMDARIRLCPYYFAAGNQVTLAGILATACPKDKKLIHGMMDAVMMPCRASAV